MIHPFDVAHVNLNVTDLDRAIRFYGDSGVQDRLSVWGRCRLAQLRAISGQRIAAHPLTAP